VQQTEDYEALEDTMNSDLQNGGIKVYPKLLVKKMIKQESSFMYLVCNTITER
jgi:hypothetical protein